MTDSSQADIQHFHDQRESHGDIGIPLIYVEVETFHDEQHADDDQESKRKHLDGGETVDEIADEGRKKNHDDHGYHDGGNHDVDIIA